MASTCPAPLLDDRRRGKYKTGRDHSWQGLRIMSHLNDAELDDIAHRMLADYDAATPGTIFAEGFRLEVPDAWRLQTAVTRLREARGEQVVGYKIGCVFPGNQEMMGLSHPVWGRLWAGEVHEDGVALRKADYANVALEAEFGVILSRDIAPGASLDEVAGSVETLYPVLELHDLTMRGEAPRGHELIANNCINCGVVRGTPVGDLAEARETDLKLIYDGQVVDSWETVRWPGDVLAAVGWLAERLAGDGMGLKAGDLILTGAWGPPIPVADYTGTQLTSSAFGDVNATFT